MDDYREYLELFEYFGQAGDEKLSRSEYETLAREWRELVAGLATGSAEQRARFATLKKLLLRDRP